MERDKLVFTEVRKNRGKPIFMVTSGGYQVGVVSGWGQSAAMYCITCLGSVSHLSHVCHALSLCCFGHSWPHSVYTRVISKPGA